MKILLHLSKSFQDQIDSKLVDLGKPEKENREYN